MKAEARTREAEAEAEKVDAELQQEYSGIPIVNMDC